jgi:hypothetical protein
MIQGLEWDLTIISPELAELVEKEVAKYLDARSPRYRDEYQVIKSEIYSLMPSTPVSADRYTVIRIGLGRRNTFHRVMEFTSSSSGTIWMDYSIDISAARTIVDFAKH